MKSPCLTRFALIATLGFFALQSQAALACQVTTIAYYCQVGKIPGGISMRRMGEITVGCGRLDIITPESKENRRRYSSWAKFCQKRGGKLVGSPQ